MKRLLIVLLVTTVLASAMVAHGDKKHVKGTVEKINADSIVVKVQDGSSVLIKLGSSTVYMRHAGDAYKSAKSSDLAVGDLVVIHATPKDSGLEADEVKFSTHAGAAAAAKPNTKP